MAITAKNKANEREVEMMVGKAMCAWANWHGNKNAAEKALGSAKDFHNNRALICESEYEATCRCIAMFAVEPLPEVCQTIIDRAKSEFSL